MVLLLMLPVSHIIFIYVCIINCVERNVTVTDRIYLFLCLKTQFIIVPQSYQYIIAKESKVAILLYLLVFSEVFTIFNSYKA